MKRPTGDLGDVLLLFLAIAIGVGGMYAADVVFYYHGRAGIPVALALFWGGVLLMIASVVWVVVRAVRRK